MPKVHLGARLVLLASLLSCCSAVEATTYKDLRDYSGPIKYEVGFCARESPASGGGVAGLPGHAFVSLREVDSEGESRFVAIGHQPGQGTLTSDEFSNGRLTEENYTDRTQDCLLIAVTPQQYARVEAIVRPKLEPILTALAPNADLSSFGNLRTYKLLANDCITMAQDAATALGLNVPKRANLDTPLKYLAKLKRANP